MGSLDSFLNIMKSRNSSEDYDDYDDEYDDSEEVYEAPKKKKGRKTEPVEEEDYQDETAKNPFKSLIPQKNNSKNNFTSRKDNSVNESMEVCVCKPGVYDDAPKIADALLDNRSVVMNLEGLDPALATKIFDFATGACYALRGRLEPISKNVYLITPESVSISGDTNSDQGAFGPAFNN